MPWFSSWEVYDLIQLLPALITLGVMLWVTRGFGLFPTWAYRKEKAAYHPYYQYWWPELNRQLGPWRDFWASVDAEV
jgi:hypothetical protein